MNNSIRKQLLWGKRHSTIGIPSKLNKGEFIQAQGKIIQSKNGICVKYRSKLTGEIEFEDVDNVYYGIENFSSNLILYNGDALREIATGIYYLVDWADSDKYLTGIIYDDLFVPAQFIDMSKFEVVSHAYESEKALANSSSDFLNVFVDSMQGQNGFWSSLVDMRDEKKQLFYRYRTNVNNPNYLISVLDGIVSALSIAKNKQQSQTKGYDTLFIHVSNSFLQVLAKGGLLTKRVNENDFVFGKIDYSNFESYFKDYLNFIEEKSKGYQIVFKEEDMNNIWNTSDIARFRHS